MEELTTIQSKIYEIRGQRVMLDFDLAALYQVTTSALNQAVKRNIERFPEEFMFRISEIEWKNMSSQFVTTSRVKRPKASLPYAFTEQGVAMLSAVLRSGMAIQVSISIMKAFVAMRNYITTATTVTSELAEIRAKLALLERRHAQGAGQHLRGHRGPVGQSARGPQTAPAHRVQTPEGREITVHFDPNRWKNSLRSKAKSTKYAASA